MGQITRKLRVLWGSVKGIRGGFGDGGVMDAGELRCGHGGRVDVYQH